MKYDKVFVWKNAHSQHRLGYHLVFTPKYRRKVIRGKLIRRLYDLFFEAAKANQWFIHELNIKYDHTHMMIQLPPNIPVSKAVMYLKGGTSRIIRKEFPELREFLWGDSLWQDGYFAEAVGRINEKKMRQYIKAQWEQESAASHGL